MKPSILSKLLTATILAFCFSCSVEYVPDELTPENINLRQNGGCQLTIVGNIVNTFNYEDLEDVTLESDLFSTSITTDEDGNFTAKIFYPEDGSLAVSDVTVMKEGFIESTFSFDAAKVLESGQSGPLGLSVNPLVTTIEWNIGLTPLRAPVELEANGPTTIMFDDVYTIEAYSEGSNQGLTEPELVQITTSYTIQISADATGPIGITPNHNFVYGAGIDSDSSEGTGLASFHIEAPEDTVGSVRIQFMSSLPISLGDEIVMSSDDAMVTSVDSNTGNITITINLDGDVTNVEVINTTKRTSSNISRQQQTQISRQRVSNCRSCDAIAVKYIIANQNLESQDIDLPLGVSDEVAALILMEIREAVNIGNTMNAGSLADNNTEVSVDPCLVVELTTVLTTTTYTGTVCGYRYTYVSTGQMATDIRTAGNCSIDDPDGICHQGGCN